MERSETQNLFAQGIQPNMMLCNSFPQANGVSGEEESLDPHEAYKNCKIRLNTRSFYQSILEKDLK